MVSQFSGFRFEAAMQESNEPKLFPQEEVYLRLQNGQITLEDNDRNAKIKNGNVLLTTHRILFYIGQEGLEVPLFNVSGFEKLGGMFATSGVKMNLWNHQRLSPNVVDYYQNVLRNQNLPSPPQLGNSVSLRFHDKTRDRFYELVQDSHRGKQWEKRIITESMRQQQPAMPGPTEQPGRVYGGLASVARRKEQQSAYTQDQITDAFSDLESLKEKSRHMVQIAEQIKGKLARNELDGTTEEMKEIQAVMFNMGISSDFSTQVSKDTSGKMYHQALALEVEKFLATFIEQYGGVVGLVELYCMYNRARGTDLISPDDLSIACKKLNETSQRFILKQYPSGVVTVQSRHFNEEAYFQRMAETIQKSQGGMSANKLAEQMKVNVILMKEHLQAAEEKGTVCRDESFEGTVYYENRISMAAF